jgi:asparagine synthase (glutamine-hydrolysing)
MCGICGVFNYQDHAPVDQAVLREMADSISHRGPDDDGYFSEGALGLGFRRLSIIDLSGGHQPMSDSDETTWVVFNGEIYNFLELREELISAGFVFRTKSDTEVILNGYKRWGDEVFRRLNGMFGVAIWDRIRRRLVIARDSMGIKVVYYNLSRNGIVFGSEIRPILAALERSPEVDPVSVNLFLRYRYTPSPFTIYKGISKLSPGTMLVVENGQARVSRWSMDAPTVTSQPVNEDSASEELLAIYKRAIKRHLISDVPVGLLLSGGIDSGLILGLMNLSGGGWPTYSVGYGSSFKDDELVDAAGTARHFGSPNHQVLLDRDRFEKELPRIIRFLEEPIASSSIVPMFFVCERAREDVKVALVGQGPDELFGGYTRHLGVRYGNYWRHLPATARNLVKSSIKALPRNEALKRGIYSLDVADRAKRYQATFSILPGDVLDDLFLPGLLPEQPGDAILDSWAELLPLISGTDELGGFQYLEVRSSLPDELLMYADKLSMAHGLEVRVPYLDREIVEFAERLPQSLKVSGFTTKWLHRKVCKSFLPNEIIARKKRGFAVNVVDSWFNETASRKYMDYFNDTDSRMYGFLSQAKVLRLLEMHRSKRGDFHKILFSLIMFEEWHRITYP